MTTLSDNEYIIVSGTDEDLSEDEEEDEICYRVMSIDIGIIHLGLSIGLLRSDYSLIDIIWIDLIDITQMHHKRVNFCDCKLFHSNCFTDWLEHFFQEYKDFFDNVDYILIERQPPMGLVAIEQLIFSKYRRKSILISPNAMHKYFKINDYDYDNRKLKTLEIAGKYLTDLRLIEQMDIYDRAHDITDSICIMVFWFQMKNKEYIQKLKDKSILNNKYNFKTQKLTNQQWLETHMFTKTNQIMFL